MPPRLLSLVASVFLSAALLHAGGPAFVAGSGYNSGVEGQPMVWANASVQYFTDQGDLSSILPPRRQMLSWLRPSVHGPARPASD